MAALSTYEAMGVSAWRGKEVSMLAVATHALADYLILAYLAYFMVKIARGRPPDAKATAGQHTHADKTALR